MNEKIQQGIIQIIEEKGQFQEETKNALEVVLDCFLKQFVVNLRDVHDTKEKIKPIDIPATLKNLNFSDTFIYKNKEAFDNYIKEQKSLKIKRLREAGFGATNEHAQLHRRILDSPHQSYVRNETQEILMEGSDDDSEFGSP